MYLNEEIKSHTVFLRASTFPAERDLTRLDSYSFFYSYSLSLSLSRYSSCLFAF